MKQHIEESDVLDLMDPDYDLDIARYFGKREEEWRDEKKDGGGDEEDGTRNGKKCRGEDIGRK